MPTYKVSIERKYKDVSIVYVSASTEEAAYVAALDRAAQTVYDDPPAIVPDVFQFEVIDVLAND